MEQLVELYRLLSHFQETPKFYEWYLDLEHKKNLIMATPGEISEKSLQSLSGILDLKKLSADKLYEAYKSFVTP